MTRVNAPHTSHHVETDHVPEGEGRRLSFRLEIDADPQAVWEALTDASELKRWFPFQARVKPGNGGSIWMSWDGNWEHENRIEIWEPGKRLRTTWAEEPKTSPLAVDYEIEGHGGRTTLRLVHHGFGPDESWDETYGGIRRGWSFELRCLRHYLENHRGQERRVATARIPLRESTSIAAAWELLLAPECLGSRTQPDGIARTARGHHLVFETAEGNTFEGPLLFQEAPRELAIRVLGWKDAIFRAMIERCGPEGSLAAEIWLETWGVDPERVSSLEEGWRRTFAPIF